MLNNSKAYIYLRSHTDYDKYNVYNIGFTYDYLEEDKRYKLNEIQKGFFKIIYEIKKSDIKNIFNKLLIALKQYRLSKDASPGFHNKIIIEMIEPYFQKNNIKYRTISEEIIKNKISHCRALNNIKKINKRKFLETLISEIAKQNNISYTIMTKNNMSKILFQVNQAK
jgi:hypothetical protein